MGRSLQTIQKIRDTLRRRRMERGFVNSPETRAKMAAAKRGAPGNHTTPLTVESRRKISETLRGRPGNFRGKTHTAASRALMSAHAVPKIGPSNPRWRGGVATHSRKERIRFRRFVGKRIFHRDNFTCAFCGTRGGVLHVDHVAGWAEFVDLRYEPENLRTLCRSCHFTRTFHKPAAESNGWCSTRAER